MNDSIMYLPVRHSLFLLASVVNKNEGKGAGTGKWGEDSEGRSPKIKEMNLKLVT